MLNYIPQFFTKKSMTTYLVGLVIISLLFFSFAMSFLWIVFGLVEVIGFFYFSNLLTKRWKNIKTKIFQKKLFWIALAIRVGWVVFSYFFYLLMNGEPFEFSAADSHAYEQLATDLATRGYEKMQSVFYRLQINDMGYGVYLGTVYILTGKSIFLARILKAIWSAWTVVLIYKIGSRNFGESTGRIAGIIAMLFPNLILYCGLHLKEVEMVFLATLFIERADNLLRSNKFGLLNILIVTVTGVLLFTFRTVLGVAAFFALFSALLFSSQRVFKMGKRFVIGVWLVLAVGYLATGSIANEVEQYWEGRFDNQEQSMYARSVKKGGNRLAKYGTGAIFAPAVFLIPVSTMVHIDGQENQRLINGGNYIKNILSFFIYLSIFLIWRNKKWKDFVLIEVFFLSYLAVIALSAFAHSERFHQPALPIYLIFVSYGIANSTNKTKRYFNMYAVLVFFALLAWNFVKLKGRAAF